MRPVLQILILILAGCSATTSPDTLRLTRHVEPEDLAPTLAQLDSGVRTIVCDSPGGDTQATQRLASEVERRGITVVVPAGATCGSGGARLVLAAARNGRAVVSERATVALHPRYGTPTDWRPGMDRTGFVRRPFEVWAPEWMAYGVSEATMRLVEQKDHSTFYRLSSEELVALGVKVVP